jgi:hypothetical protein
LDIVITKKRILMEMDTTMALLTALPTLPPSASRTEDQIAHPPVADCYTSEQMVIATRGLILVHWPEHSIQGLLLQKAKLL